MKELSMRNGEVEEAQPDEDENHDDVDEDLKE